MKKIILITTILLSSILLTSCSSLESDIEECDNTSNRTYFKTYN